MNDFNWSGYEKWLDPPEVHELDECLGCHEEGLHDDNLERWARYCELCADLLDEIELAKERFGHKKAA